MQNDVGEVYITRGCHERHMYGLQLGMYAIPSLEGNIIFASSSAYGTCGPVVLVTDSNITLGMQTLNLKAL